jgi:hypothetical protein
MQIPIYDRYSYDWTGHGRDSVNMNERQHEATPSRPQSLQLPIPVPSASRWSRTTYSLSVYEDDRLSDDGTPFRAVALSADAPNTADGTEKKSIITFSRLMKVLGALAVFAVAVALVILLTKALMNSEPSDPERSSTATHKPTTPTVPNQPQGADRSPTTTSDSSTATVVQVATQVIQTTVGTLTESAFSTANTT